MGSGFESQGAHFTENPADSSESAGFLRFLNKCSFVVRGAYYPLCSCRGPVLAELGHPDVAAEDICTSACIGILGTLRSRRGCGRCAVVQYVRPVPSELWRGRLSRFSVLRGGWMLGLVRRVFRKRPQGVTRTLSAAKQGGAERPGDGCPCVGAEETCGAPTPE